jgi:hypothetical protein
MMPRRSLRQLAAQASVIAILNGGQPSLGLEPIKHPVPLTAPLNSGVCGRCGNGRCPSPLGEFRCVQLFDLRDRETVRSTGCDLAGRFRATLTRGQYVLDRDISGSRDKVRHPVVVDVRKDAWTRLDAVSETQCPDSGIYGLDYVPCRGAPPGLGTYQCVTVLDRKTGAAVASGQCYLGDPIFNVPLPPGRYTVESQHGGRQTVEVTAGQWLRLGVTEAYPCPSLR